MRALLYEYSSSSEDFTFDCDTTVYNPATMTKAQWLVVIRLLWSSFKDKLLYDRQKEYQHARSLYPAVRHKPYSGKVVKASSGPVTSMTAAASVAKAPSIPGRIAVAVTPVRTKRGKNKRSVKSSSPSSRAKKVEFGVAICISDLAKQYNVKINLEACKPDCPYMHYDQLPPNLTSASVLSKVKKIIGKLNLSLSSFSARLKQIQNTNRIWMGIKMFSFKTQQQSTMPRRKRRKKYGSVTLQYVLSTYCRSLRPFHS